MHSTHLILLLDVVSHRVKDHSASTHLMHSWSKVAPISGLLGDREGGGGIVIKMFLMLI